ITRRGAAGKEVSIDNFGSATSPHVFGLWAGSSLSLRYAMTVRFRRWATQKPSSLRAAAGSLSKNSGRNLTSWFFLTISSKAAGSEAVRRSTTVLPAASSVWKRWSTCSPPVRNTSTLKPYFFSKASPTTWACRSGVEVYQTTAPSLLAASTSALSKLPDGDGAEAAAAGDGDAAAAGEAAGDAAAGAAAGDAAAAAGEAAAGAVVGFGASVGL